MAKREQALASNVSPAPYGRRRYPTALRLYLINPSNPLVSIVNVNESRWNRYRVWKPLSLMVLAGLTPPDWEIIIVDENLGRPDYSAMPRPDLVGITAFTSQANRAYEVAAHFRQVGVPVVMGGIHATLCLDEVMEHVDSVVTGEAESVWAEVLADTQHGRPKRRYDGGLTNINDLVAARHDLLPARYAFGAIQTTRGCPLNCNFCSVTTFNGAQYRQRPIPDVIREFQSIREKRVLVVDDNLIGTRPEHVARAKDLFRALAQANLRKQWVAQATINFGDDEELLALAARAGCRGVFIGFESPTPEGLRELGKKFNLVKGRDFRASVQRIQRHGILVVGSFIIGLDVDEPGIGRRIARVASEYGLDNLNTLFLTPLPGTRLWDQMKSEARIALNAFPEDWKYYTLTFPVARYKHFSQEGIIREMLDCNQRFYSLARILRRAWNSFWHRRHPLISLVGNLSYRSNIRVDSQSYADFEHDLRSLFGPNQMKQMQPGQPGNLWSQRKNSEEMRPLGAQAIARCAHSFKLSPGYEQSIGPNSLAGPRCQIRFVSPASMHVLKLICQATVGLFKQACLLPQSVAAALRQRRRQFALNALEAERLDRIRNPSKYLGK